MTLQFPDWAQISPKRRAHVERVAAVCLAWADAMQVSAAERARWLKAVMLHDSLKSAPKQTLRDLVPDSWEATALLHGPAAAARAELAGETDRGVLDAVHYHSIGYAGWDMTGKILYAADYLEPGRSYHNEKHETLVTEAPRDFAAVLRAVAAERISDTLALGRPLIKETVEFWNSIAGGS
jgi:HD superfamily phosphohydrolase YqeK